LKLQIENFTSLTGWAGSSVKASTYGLNELPEFIAGLNDKSAIFKFENSPAGEYMQKTISADLTGYEEIVFHIWSRNQKGKGLDYKLSSDYAYKIEFGTSDIFFIPTFDTFSDVTIDIRGMTNINKIKITALKNIDDYIILSEMVAVKDEFPVDIFRSVKEQLENDLNSLYPRINGGIASKGIFLGTISGSAGDKEIVFNSTIKIAEKYAVIKIDDGIHSETHQIDRTDELAFVFNSNYSGKTLIYSYTNANIYLIIPVNYGLQEDEILLPGISISGLNPEEMIDINKLDHPRDTFKSDETVEERGSDANFHYLVLIDGEGRTNEMIAFMSLLIRYFLARQILWINGKRIEIRPEGSSSFVEPIEGYNQIPKIQYTMAVTIKEEVYNRQKLFKTISNIRIFDIRRP
jgi:hypothetical protein